MHTTGHNPPNGIGLNVQLFLLRGRGREGGESNTHQFMLFRLTGTMFRV